MERFHYKKFITAVALIALCFLLCGLGLFFSARHSVVENTWRSMDAAAEELTHAVNAYHAVGGVRNLDLRVNLSNVARTTGFHIFLATPDGMVVSCSDSDLLCPHIGWRFAPHTLSRIRQAGTFRERGDLARFYPAARLISAQVAVSYNGRTEGYVFVSCEPSAILADWSRALSLFIGLTLLLLLLSVVVVWFVYGRHAHPIREMAQAAHSFSKGNFSVRVAPCPGRGELSELTEAFNVMAEELDKTEHSRRALISNVSHELRTPMTSIAGFADGILDGTIAPQDAPKYLQTISSETKRLSRLVRSMLDMSRLQEEGAVSFVPFDHTEMLLQTLLNFETRINEKSLDVQLDMPEEHLFALGHPDSLTRVVYNLLDNAVKFAAAGSVLSVTLWRDAGTLFTRITDHGETIAPEDLPLIFERFQKIDRSRSLDRDGAGLGLYMVKAILDSHDQDIYVSSENGETAFVFTLTEASAPNP